MTEISKRSLLETEAIVIGYAMSRLDQEYLAARRCTTWQAAYTEAANALAKPPQTFNNLRDEFDPVHPNGRQGWHNRTMRPSRQKVLEELKEVSDKALLELVRRILTRDAESTAQAIEALVPVNRIAHNVAERLLTGRRAEEYFLANVQTIIQVTPEQVLDFRQAACGYDFGIQHQPERAIEIKGMKGKKGIIQFTDREWAEGHARKENYWVVIIGNLENQPLVQIVRDPHQSLYVQSHYRQTLIVEWRSTITLPLPLQPPE